MKCMTLTDLRNYQYKDRAAAGRNAGVNRHTVWNWENRGTERLLVSTLRKFAEAVGGELHLVVVTRHGEQIEIVRDDDPRRMPQRPISRSEAIAHQPRGERGQFRKAGNVTPINR